MAARSFAKIIVLALFIGLLVPAPLVNATSYAIHLIVPQSAPNQTPEQALQVAQWISSAQAAAQQVTSQWSSTSGNTLEVLVLDNKGDSVLNMENAVTSIQNTSNVVSLLVNAFEGTETPLIDDLARVGRVFQIPVVSATARSTGIEATTSSALPNTFFSVATAQGFDARVFAALMGYYGWTDYSVISDGFANNMDEVVNAAINMPSLNSSFNFKYDFVLNNNPQSSLQQLIRNDVNVLFIIGTNATALNPFLVLAANSHFADGRFGLLDGYPTMGLQYAPDGVQVLDIVDANMTMRTDFVAMMSGAAGFLNTTNEDNVADHAIHSWDAVMAIARAIEVAEMTSIPATRAAVLTALNNSDYNGLSGAMKFDSRGFRNDGYARMLNPQNGVVVTPWIYEQGVFTVLAPSLYPGHSFATPDDKMQYIALGQLASNLAGPYDLTGVIQFAIDLVNENHTYWMPPETRFFLISYDDHSTTSGEVSGAIYMENYGAVGIIGPTTSTLALASQNVLGPYGIPQLSVSATSSALSDKSQYPTFLRNSQSNGMEAAAFIGLCQYFGWTKVAVISASDAYGADLVQNFVNAAAAAQINVLTQVVVSASDTQIDDGMKQIKRSGALILILLVDSVNLKAITSSLATVDYHPSAIVGPDSFLSAGVDYLAYASGLPASTFEGWLTVNPPPGFGPFWDFVQTRAIAAQANYSGLTTWLNLQSPIMALTVDAVFTYADAIRRMVNSGQDYHNGTALYEALLATNLTLSTGPTSFTSTGDRLGPFAIVNIRNGTENFAGIFNNLNNAYTPFNAVTWLDGTTNVPPDTVPRVPTWLKWNSGAGIAMAALGGAGLVFVAGVFAVIVWQRESTIIISATWEFLIIMLLGSALGYGSMFTWIGRPEKWICALRIWLPPIAFVLMAAPLLAKTWRLHRIFTLGSLKITPIKLWKLLIFAGLLVLVQIVICAFWIGLGTIEPITINSTSDLTTSYVLCEQKQANQIATWITFGWTGLTLLIGAYYAFRVRNLPKEWNESRWIGFSIYNSILSSVIVIVLGYSLSSFPVTVQILTCICTFVISTGCVGLMMFPKVWVLIMYPEKRSSSGSGRGSHNKAKGTRTTNSGSLVSMSMTASSNGKRHNYTRYSKDNTAGTRPESVTMTTHKQPSKGSAKQNSSKHSSKASNHEETANSSSRTPSNSSE